MACSKIPCPLLFTVLALSALATIIAEDAYISLAPGESKELTVTEDITDGVVVRMNLTKGNISVYLKAHYDNCTTLLFNAIPGYKRLTFSNLRIVNMLSKCSMESNETIFASDNSTNSTLEAEADWNATAASSSDNETMAIMNTTDSSNITLTNDTSVAPSTVAATTPLSLLTTTNASVENILNADGNMTNTTIHIAELAFSFVSNSEENSTGLFQTFPTSVFNSSTSAYTKAFTTAANNAPEIRTTTAASVVDIINATTTAAMTTIADSNQTVFFINLMLEEENNMTVSLPDDLPDGLSVGASVSEGELIISVDACSSSQQIIKTTGTKNYYADNAQVLKWQGGCNQSKQRASGGALSNRTWLTIVVTGTGEGNNCGAIGYSYEKKEIFDEEASYSHCQMKSNVSGRGVAGIVVGCIVIFIILAAALFVLLRQKRWFQRRELPTMDYEMLSH